MQQINLYQEQFYEKKAKLPATQMLSIFFVTLLFCALISALDFADVRDLQKKSDRMLAQRNASEQRLNDYAKKFPKPTLNSQLIKQRDDKRVEAKEKLALLKILDESRIGSEIGFSDYMAGLSKQIVGGVSLTAFRFSNGGKHIRLDGLTDKPEKVPEYIQMLGNEKAFTGKEFDTFTLNKNPEIAGTSTFSLSAAGAAEHDQAGGAL